MKHLLLTTIAAVLVVVGCGKSQEVKDIQLRLAADKGNIEAVKKNLADGADVNAKKDDGSWTSLHSAAMKGHQHIVYLRIVELLITKGADVNAKDEDGHTPLYFAAVRDHKEITELLIAAGADVNAKDDDGGTPLDFAGAEIADLLRKHGGKTGQELKAEGK